MSRNNKLWNTSHLNVLKEKAYYNQTSIIRGTWEYWILASKTADNRGPRMIEAWLYLGEHHLELLHGQAIL